VNYYNFILDNDMLTDEGYILADNVLFSGLVLNSEQRKRDAAAASASSSSSSSSSSSASSSTTTAFSKGKGKKGKNGEAWGGDTFQKFADHIDTFNKHVRSDPRVDVVLLPAFDGLSLIMKKRQ
jgi:predicted O-methyltransferase YrrM